MAMSTTSAYSTFVTRQLKSHILWTPSASASVDTFCSSTPPENHVSSLLLLHCSGYLLTQVLGGIWADRFGGKLVLGLGVLWWSLATACTPIAAQMGLPALLASRALMGVGEGVAMPAMNNLLSR